MNITHVEIKFVLGLFYLDPPPSYSLVTVFDAFEHWKELVRLLCSCEDALVSHKDLYGNFISKYACCFLTRGCRIFWNVSLFKAAQ